MPTKRPLYGLRPAAERGVVLADLGVRLVEAVEQHN
jgi:hypothetical protein